MQLRYDVVSRWDDIASSWDRHTLIAAARGVALAELTYADVSLGTTV